MDDPLSESYRYYVCKFNILKYVPALVIMRSAGILPVLHPLLNELYPTEIRTFSIGITQSGLLLSGCTSVKLFPELKNVIGIPGLCILYSGVGLICMMWGAWTIPDNRGKSLVKVEETFEKKPVESPVRA